MRSILKKTILLLAPASLALAWFAPGASAALTAKANHDHVEINFNYHGSTVSVSGKCDPDADIIVKITGGSGEEKLKKMDKVAGAIWMSTDQLSFGKTPGVYFLRSTRKPEDILSGQELLTNGIGYSALSQKAEITPHINPLEKNTLFAEFLKYKESKQLFTESVGGIDMAAEDGGQTYSTVFDWPYQVPPGQYQVTVYAVHNGAVIDTTTSEVTVEEAGTVKMLGDMAREKGALYGVAAIGVALTTGIGVGIIFGKGGGAH